MFRRSNVPRPRWLLPLLLLLFAALPPGQGAEPAPPTPGEVREAIQKGAQFYRQSVARHGGYVYYYSLDLDARWGEGKAGPDTIVVQPPGTPTVGLAYLRAHTATQDPALLEGARAAAEALVAGQLQSGGWTQTIHFGNPAKGERVGQYRHRRGGDWNASSLDDGQTQAALQLLFETDRVLQFRHEAIHEAAEYGLNALLQAQFPNGAFPQVWRGAVEPQPIRPARYPEYDWRTEGRLKNYWDYYTLNDGLAGSVAETLITADQVYGEERIQQALLRLGEFLLLAQMPDPQPGWCQQYSYDMVPIWARKFEPPAVTGWECQDVMRTLIRIAEYTRQPKFLEPIPRALAYYRRSLLPDGQVARYYELKTNRPLYMDADYRLTYDDAHAPPHYGWKQKADFDGIERAYQAARQGSASGLGAAAPAPSESEVRHILAQLDSEGRWVSTYAGERLVGQPKFPSGFRYLSSEQFARNLETLAAYLGRP